VRSGLFVRLRLPADFRKALPAAGSAGGDSGQAAGSADRIVSLHTYRVGDWYPFRSVGGRLTDPKTTAAVGAMVCALSEGQLYNSTCAAANWG